MAYPVFMRLFSFLLCIAALIGGWVMVSPAWAASVVYVIALGYDKAEVSINGSAARAMWVGEILSEGVRLRSVEDGAAVFEIDGKLWTLRPGQASYSQTTLQADARGQFFLTAQINGMPVKAVIDTGATSVTMNSEDANRLGIDYLRGQRVVTQTANGPSSAYLVALATVQVGEIVLTNVQGVVMESSNSQLPLVLIGMSFLREVDMQRSGNTMRLQRRYY